MLHCTMATGNFLSHAIENLSQVINFIPKNNPPDVDPRIHVTPTNSHCRFPKFNNRSCNKLISKSNRQQSVKASEPIICTSQNGLPTYLQRTFPQQKQRKTEYWQSWKFNPVIMEHKNRKSPSPHTGADNTTKTMES